MVTNRKGPLKQRAGSIGQEREPNPPFRTADWRLFGLSDTVIAARRYPEPRSLRAVPAADLAPETPLLQHLS